MFQVHYQNQSQRPLTTAHLAQTMTLLGLTNDELKQQIESELASNPALELKEERRCPTCHRMLPEKTHCPVCSQQQTVVSDEPVVFISPREDFYPTREAVDEYQPDDRDFSPAVEELPAYVLRQVAQELTDPQDRKLAAYLLAHHDEDGLLTIEPVEAAYYYHIPLSRVEAVQKVIQRADPVGVCSVNTQQALLVQLELLAETQVVPDLAQKIIRDAMDLLTHRQYNEIAHRFNTGLRQVQEAVHFIGDNLNPFPGRSHWGDVRQPASEGVEVYHRPDIIISLMNDDLGKPLVVEIVMPIHGILRINPLFKLAIQQANPEKREEWKNDYERASLFVKCLQQRNNTMQRLMQRVAGMQREFILFGEKHLKPVTRVSISRDLEVHESTISRAVSGKTVQLPNRKIIPLSSFFDRSLNVRTVLRDMIATESSPLSDSDLVDMLTTKGFEVARRTVAKYRAMEGILPAHMRRSISHTA
jgi:RNA polymerase sigma-54 factor